MDEELWLYLCHQGSHLFCFGSERGKQLKCLIAIFRAAFILKEEKSENIKIQRNDSKRIGNPYLRMNYAFWKVLWLLFITVRGKSHSSFCTAASAVGIPFLNGVYQRWGWGKCPQRFALANQSKSTQSLVHASWPDRSRDRVQLVHSWGFMGGVSCHSSQLLCSSLFGSFWQNLSFLQLSILA